MATDAQVMNVRARLLDIEEFASRSHNWLCTKKDEQPGWFAVRTTHMETLVKRLRVACEETAS